YEDFQLKTNTLIPASLLTPKLLNNHFSVFSFPAMSGAAPWFLRKVAESDLLRHLGSTSLHNMPLTQESWPQFHHLRTCYCLFGEEGNMLEPRWLREQHLRFLASDHAESLRDETS